MTASVIAMLRRPRGWIRWSSGFLGFVLLGFTAWLVVGLVQTLHRGLSAMLVPRAGPGLFVSGVGAAIVAAAPILMSTRPADGRARLMALARRPSLRAEE